MSSLRMTILVPAVAAATALSTLVGVSTGAASDLSRKGSAPGGPGDKASWTAADKHGFGTSRSVGSEVWFTLRPGQLSEVYYPDLGTPRCRTWSSWPPTTR